MDSTGLVYPYSVTVSPDDMSVYVASYTSNVIAHFDRNTSTGGLSNMVNYDANSVNGPAGVIVSPDGKSVYAVTWGSDSIVRWDRYTNNFVAVADLITDVAGGDDIITDVAGGDDITDGCDLPENNIHLLDDGSILYNTTDAIAGFQFDVDGATVTGASGGDAAAAGFVVQAAGSTVLGFSFTGSSVPAGCGTLTSLSLSGDATGLSAITISLPTGAALPFESWKS